MDERKIVSPSALIVAKVLSLISVLVVCFSGLHLIFDWTIFKPERVEVAFAAGLVLMMIAMAFNGKALGYSPGESSDS